MIVQPADLRGQGSVGTILVVPWWPGAWELSQGWGATDYTGEPEGHGYAHWHAGVDLAVGCGTPIVLPSGLSGTARAIDNPGGYGTALIVQLAEPEVDILLGHLRQRLVSNGDELRGGQELAVSNSTGNSTGCHVHFEVRPRGGRYGTDIDPTGFLLTPGDQAASDVRLLSANGNPYNPLDPRAGFWDLQHGLSEGFQSALDAGQVALGGVVMLAGLLVAAYGLRGQSAMALQRTVVRTVKRRRQARTRELAAQARAEQRRNRDIYRAQQRRRPIVVGPATPAEIAQSRAQQVRRSRMRRNLQQRTA